MTSSLMRGRPRRAAAHISVRVAHAVVGGVAGVVWLVLPGMTISTDVPVARTSEVRAVAAAPEEDESSAADLVLPLVLVATAGALAGYGYLRRTRRARTRTTPGGAPATFPSAPPLTELDEQARALSAEADDWIRTSRAELGFVAARFGEEAVAPFTAAVRDAEAELSAAFRMRRRYDEGVPADEDSRRQVLAGIVGRCQEAGRRLDAEAPAFDQLRALERDAAAALEIAETRFRELAGRTAAAETILTGLAERYPPAACAPVTGYVEQAKDRLVFATVHLNQARQATDRGDPEHAARDLRAAEGAVAQAAVFVAGIDRLAEALDAAARLVPAALTGAEAALTQVRGLTATEGIPAGELHARVRHADAVLTVVREEVAAGPYDPLDALRRVVGALTPLDAGRAGVVSAAGALVARSSTDLADGFVDTHRGAVGGPARERLAEARRLLAEDAYVSADTLAREARDLAEQDVRVHGNPVAGAAGHASGVAGAVLGGILLGSNGDEDGGVPVSFGGPRTRGRRTGA
ncbi:hypothetical protein [Streptomyces sp. YU58]|uniref:hypothetical protein n=1 Tax=Streptomyces sp. SX92 TaxID=3158972 RepID=UPI0027BA6FD4|nr:hypothetical protein [Streptomyces coralus]